MTVTIIILYLSAMLAAMMRPAVFFLYKSAVPTAVTSVLVAMMTTMRNAVMPSQGLSGNYHGATERDPDDCQKPRAGSVCLNSLRAVAKWISALVMPQPGLAAAR